MPGTEDSVEDMLKFIYVILMNLFRAPYMIPKMHKEAEKQKKYSEEDQKEIDDIIEQLRSFSNIYPLKDKIIHVISNLSAVKAGATNVNGVDY